MSGLVEAIKKFTSYIAGCWPVEVAAEFSVRAALVMVMYLLWAWLAGSPTRHGESAPLVLTIASVWTWMEREVVQHRRAEARRRFEEERQRRAEGLPSIEEYAAKFEQAVERDARRGKP